MINTAKRALSKAADVAEVARAVGVLISSGLVDLRHPRVIAAVMKANAAHGPATAAVMKAVATHPDRPAVTDEQGTLTFAELDRNSDVLAQYLLDSGIASGSAIGMLARDHRGLMTTVIAAGKAGYQLVMMNTGFAKPQFAEVVRREGVTAVLYDSEFEGLLDELPADLPRIITWVESDEQPRAQTRVLDDILAAADPGPITLPVPAKPAGITVLTSGTTGLPKGAPRAKISPIGSAMLLDRLPIPRDSSVVVATPMFHGTGFALWLVSAGLGNRVVTMRRFDAESTLRSIADTRAELLVAVPTMLSRLVALGPDVISRYDLTSLRGIVVAGSALSPELSVRVQETFGPVLYNLYGSTEVAVASVATPQELLRAPGTVGRAPVTTDVVLIDNGAKVTAPGARGVVHVRCAAAFGGYTDGSSPAAIDGYMTTGDVGHFDAEGLLFIDGRADDMIVSGGENVYPQEVENLLITHPDVADVAVIGVDDEDFGQRLRAVIVTRSGSELDDAAVRSYVKENLARHKVPRDVLFVDDLPRNPTGKIIRRALADMSPN